jgi:serine acetyltransferase
VVGAGAVVTRSLPPGSVAVGVPARVVARRGEPGAVQHPVDDLEAELLRVGAIGS